MRILLFLLFCSNFLFASVGNIVDLNGKVIIQRNTKNIQANIGAILEKRYYHNSKNANAKVKLNDGTIINIGKNSTLHVKEFILDETTPSNSKTEINIMKGAFKAITGKIGRLNPSKFKLRTSNTTIGIRGTIIIADQNSVGCLKGSITVSANGKTVILNAGEVIKTKVGKKLGVPTKLDKNKLDGLNKKLDLISSFILSDENLISKVTTKEGETIRIPYRNTKNITVSVPQEQGTVTYDKRGFITFVPNDEFVGQAEISITNEDGSTTEQILVTVNAVPSIILTDTISLPSTFSSPYVTLSSLNQNSDEFMEQISSTSVSENDSLSGFGAGKIGFMYSLEKYDAIINISNSDITGGGFSNIPNVDDISIIPNLMQADGAAVDYYYNSEDDFHAHIDAYFPSSSKYITSGDIYTYDDSNLDNESTWGYWGMIVENTDGNFINTGQQYFVVGHQTPTSVVDTLIANNQSIDFTGTMRGTLRNSSSGLESEIIVNDSNFINLTLNFGGGLNNFTGSFSFTTQDYDTWSGNINDGVVTNSNFTSTNNITGVADGDGYMDSKIEGQYFGTNTIESIGGTFELTSYNERFASGVFKADKQ